MSRYSIYRERIFAEGKLAEPPQREVIIEGMTESQIRELFDDFSCLKDEDAESWDPAQDLTVFTIYGRQSTPCVCRLIIRKE